MVEKCLYCSGPNNPFFEYDRIKKDKNNPSIKISVIDDICFLEIYKTISFYREFSINYCPMCGRKMEVDK